MSWFSSFLSSPNPLGSGNRGGGDRDRDRGRRDDRDRDRDRSRSRSKDRDRRRRDDSDSDDDRDRKKKDKKKDRRGGDEEAPKRERFDDLSSDSDEERAERKKRRKDREEKRQKEQEADLASRDKLSEEEKERLARLDRERERNRRSRFVDKDEEEDRRRRAERERERKAEEDAREALRAENEMVQVGEQLPADDAFAEPMIVAVPVEKKVVVQYLGDLDPKMNNEAAHLFWSGGKALLFIIFFAWAIYMNLTHLDVRQCNVSTQVPWCVQSASTNASEAITCMDHSTKATNTADATLTCGARCKDNAGFSGAEYVNSGCYIKRARSQSASFTEEQYADSCALGEEWELYCNDKRSCNTKFVIDTQAGFLPGLIMFILFAAVEGIHCAGLFLWTTVHPDEIESTGKANRPQRWLMYFVKFYPFFSQLMAVVTAFCWIFLYLSWNAGYQYCAEAETSLGVRITLFSQTQVYLALYLLMLTLVVCVGTYLRKFKPIRGELYVPSVDGELNPPFGCDFKDVRERPQPRVCPDLWADCEDPDAGTACKVCGTPCRIFWNTLFTMIIAPIGWAIEMFYRHRHFIGP